LGEAAAAFTEAIHNIEDLRDRTPGEPTGFFQGGRMSAHYKPYLAMINVLAAMAQKGEQLPAGLKSYGADPPAAAFYVAESMKARSLLEAITARAGRNLTQGLPADLASRERKLRDQLTALKRSGRRFFSLTTAGNRMPLPSKPRSKASRGNSRRWWKSCANASLDMRPSIIRAPIRPRSYP
jgi:hypothetical protein